MYNGPPNPILIARAPKYPGTGFRGKPLSGGADKSLRFWKAKGLGDFRAWGFVRFRVQGLGCRI